MPQHLSELEKYSSRTCKKDGECIKLIQMYVDGEACKQKYKNFLDGICDCKPCYEYFKLHDTIKEELKKRCCHKNTPKDLAENILEKLGLRSK